MPSIDLSDQLNNVNAAFSKQSFHFDEVDVANPILQQWRQSIYAHADHFLKSESNILELNAGTGIDAERFVREGHRVHATDLSDGMIVQLKKRAQLNELQNKLTVQQISSESLDQVVGEFDFVFSNFGGLNCVADITKVTQQLPRLLKPNAYITWVIMPPVCFWEWSWVFKGKLTKAFRRLNKKAVAHLEGEFFGTYYYSIKDLTKAFGPSFQLVKTEGLGVFSPPPAATNFFRNFPLLTSVLNRIDRVVGHRFPFNRSGDHLIVTFQFRTRKNG